MGHITDVTAKIIGTGHGISGDVQGVLTDLLGVYAFGSAGIVEYLYFI